MGVEDDCWHPEVVKCAVIEQGWHFRKLDLASVDLRHEIKTSALLIDGVLNDSYVRPKKHGDGVLCEGGLARFEADGMVRIYTDPEDKTNPRTNEAGWRHTIATRKGKVLEKEFTLDAHYLWLGDNNQPDPNKGYFYKILKAYRVYKCTSNHPGCKGSCARSRGM